MTDFLFGATFGILLWLWWLETSNALGNPKKQIAYVVALLLCVFLAWIL